MATKETQNYDPQQSQLIQSKFTLDAKDGKVLDLQSEYHPNDIQRDTIAMVRNCFVDSDLLMRRPRREFNDVSVFTRLMLDQMAFNTYQPNNGEPYPADEIQGWKSNAMRPIVRNKCVSIAAHATAQLIFPKVFAYNDQSDEQRDAGYVMRDLIEWNADRMDYPWFALQAILTALWSPASIAYIGYQEIYREVKFSKENGKWKLESMLDEDMTGIKGEMVGVDELYPENIYESDIQKQGWLIWRKVQSYDFVKSKYGDHPDFQYVKPGVQVLWNDANQLFYEVYDMVLRRNMCEVINFYHRGKDLHLTLVNGILVTDPDNPNPRKDKLYPFIKFGFELIDHGRFFYYKSLAFKMMQDANIVNTLYPMVIDGTYLSIIPPMVNSGGDIISSDVVVPGAVTTLKDPNSKLSPIAVSQNLASGFNALQAVENSVQETAPQMTYSTRRETAYSMALRAQEAKTLLGLFTNSIASFVKQFGKLMIGDILQFMTIADATRITDDSEIMYKTFTLHNKTGYGGKKKNRKIRFDIGLPTEPVTDEDMLKLSYENMKLQGGMNSEEELYRVNPDLFRNLKFMIQVSPDSLSPMSDDIEKAYKLEVYDRGINNPTVDQEQLTRDFLFGAYEKINQDPDKYIKKQEAVPQQVPQQAPQPQGSPLAQAMQAQGNPNKQTNLPNALSLTK